MSTNHETLLRCRKSIFLIDIDGTLTRYKPGVLAPERLLHGNFLFPVLHAFAVERGMAPDQAAALVGDLPRRIPFWDYPDFIRALGLPPAESYRRLWDFHRENLECHTDTVDAVHELHRNGKKLFVVSNNPYWGCCLKLRLCGFADEFGPLKIRGVFSTDRMLGCKGDSDAWQRVFSRIPAPLSEICIVGDNPVEDRDIPLSLGAGETFLVKRETPAFSREGWSAQQEESRR